MPKGKRLKVGYRSSTKKIAAKLTKIDLAVAEVIASIAESKAPPEPVIFHKAFSEIQLLHPQKWVAALLLDDKALVNYEETMRQEKLVLHQKHLFKAIVEQAYKHNILIALCTTRKHQSQEQPIYLSTKSIAQELGKDKISFIYYSDEGVKNNVMRHICHQYNISRENIASLESSPYQIEKIDIEFDRSFLFDAAKPRDSLGSIATFINSFEPKVEVAQAALMETEGLVRFTFGA